MNYKINDIALNSFGFIPGRSSNSNLAISGCWDMPSRIGKTHHDWKDENGVEPYLRADEMFFGGRDISLVGYVSDTDRPKFIAAIQKIYDYIDTLQDGLFTLSSDLGSWEVQVVDLTSVTYLTNGWGNVELKFRQPVVDLSGNLPAVKSAGVGIDDYSFADLGITKMLTKEQAKRPNLKQLDSTSYGFEYIAPVRRNMREFSIDFFVDHPTYDAFNSCIQNLMYLFSQPNARTLKLDDNMTREFFVKDGFKITGVRKMVNRFVGFLTIEIAEIQMLENWNTLTDASGLILVDQHGQPLAEIGKRF